MSKAAIIYWSGTGNTEAMAKSIQSGLQEKGLEADLYEVTQAGSVSLDDYSKIAFGCPSMGDEVLEENYFEPYFTSVESLLVGKKIALFGSYGWGDGQWMREWFTRVKAIKCDVFDEGLIMQEAPNAEECVQYGREFASF